MLLASCHSFITDMLHQVGLKVSSRVPDLVDALVRATTDELSSAYTSVKVY